ncbi:hypothetical protein HC028_17100 [Planosporangium flavigriseum]|uniref:Uncharacterized protein n=1 Tax=Planosporangium flavigriseum TaxID=373681 RepID=A0A8J3M3V0_9ACTN|nr:hypothetical protein [Planosporangium flavigriseum]NJC66209.1 hypothetical protein [Planosporangium flavigriseum]GIG76410.1 hypothetical protein Pfl04_48140 [Planosporangium flavigriseum]
MDMTRRLDQPANPSDSVVLTEAVRRARRRLAAERSTTGSYTSRPDHCTAP